MVKWIKKLRPLWLILFPLSLIAGLITFFNRGFTIIPVRPSERLQLTRDQLGQISESLLAFRAKHGRFPTNDQGLLTVDTWTSSPQRIEDYRELGDKGTFRGLAASDAGILSLCAVPFVYESRSGLAPTLFADSPATKDSTRRYSVQVDQDVFVYSVGGMTYQRQYSSLVSEETRRCVARWSLVAVSLLLFIISLKGIDLKVVALWAIGGGLAALFVTMPSRPPIVTCYKPAPFGYRHRPEMAAKYQEQLEKYLKAGVIHPETYEKLKKAFDKDTATLPDWLKPPHAR